MYRWVANWSKKWTPCYLKNFIPPKSWTAIGLKVNNLFDGGDNTWLGTSNVVGEWYIGYHGVKSMSSINNILFNGLRKGPGQYFKNFNNANSLANILYPQCGEGVYFSQDINDAKLYTKTISYLGNIFRVIFMCKINPYKFRIGDRGVNKDYMIVNGDRIDDMNGTKKINEVRPYRILLLKE